MITVENNITIIKAIETSVSLIQLRDDGIVQHNMKDDVVVDVKDIEQIIEALSIICKDGKYPMLILTGRRNGSTREARKLSIRELTNNYYALAEAVVISDLPTRIAGNFFYKIYKPKHPHKFFKTQTEAEKWLKKTTSNRVKL